MLSNGELYNILTNKAIKEKKGSVFGMIKGTSSSTTIELLTKKITLKKRNTVQEINFNMAESMNEISQVCFRKAIRVTDRFHVQKLELSAVQDIRIKHRWEALKMENQKYSP